MARTDDDLARLRTRVRATKRYASTLQSGDVLHTPSAAFLVCEVERAKPSGWLNGVGGVVVKVLTCYSNGDPLEHNLILKDQQEVLVFRP